MDSTGICKGTARGSSLSNASRSGSRCGCTWPRWRNRSRWVRQVLSETAELSGLLRVVICQMHTEGRRQLGRRSRLHKHAVGFRVCTGPDCRGARSTREPAFSPDVGRRWGPRPTIPTLGNDGQERRCHRVSVEQVARQQTVQDMNHPASRSAAPQVAIDKVVVPEPPLLAKHVTTGRLRSGHLPRSEWWVDGLDTAHQAAASAIGPAGPAGQGPPTWVPL